MMLHLTDFGDPDRALRKKMRDEPTCRGCGVNRSEHRVLSEGWIRTKTTDPRGAVALCGHCLEDLSHGELDLWEKLTPSEVTYAMLVYSDSEAARRALYPSDYSRSMERERRAA